jgi:hypothetical protein
MSPEEAKHSFPFAASIGFLPFHQKIFYPVFDQRQR